MNISFQFFETDCVQLANAYNSRYFFGLTTTRSGHIQVKKCEGKCQVFFYITHPWNLKIKTFIKCKNNRNLTFKVHCGFENTCTRTPGTTHKSVPGIDFFLFLKDIYFTLTCRWMWQHLEICILNTYRIYSHCSCYWTHDFYEILVNVLTNALKPWWFIIFFIRLFILICLSWF